MIDRNDQDCLLSDILADADAGQAREALLRHTLRLARRRRVFRQARRAGGTLLVAAVAVLVLGRAAAPRLPSREPPFACPLVQTQPLPPSAIVISQPLSAGSLVFSTSAAAVVSTAAEPHDFEEIGDSALLALAAPSSPVLVRLGPHTAELILAEPLNTEPPPAQSP
jgi:hypothetical protein